MLESDDGCGFGCEAHNGGGSGRGDFRGRIDGHNVSRNGNGGMSDLGSDPLFSSISPLSCVVYDTMNLALGLAIVVVGVQLIGV